MLPILGVQRPDPNPNDTLQQLAVHFAQREERSAARPVDAEKIICFLFELAFATVDIRNDVSDVFAFVVLWCRFFSRISV